MCVVLCVCVWIGERRAACGHQQQQQRQPTSTRVGPRPPAVAVAPSCGVVTISGSGQPGAGRSGAFPSPVATTRVPAVAWASAAGSNSGSSSSSSGKQKAGATPHACLLARESTLHYVAGRQHPTWAVCACPPGWGCPGQLLWGTWGWAALAAADMGEARRRLQVAAVVGEVGAAVAAPGTQHRHAHRHTCVELHVWEWPVCAQQLGAVAPGSTPGHHRCLAKVVQLCPICKHRPVSQERVLLRAVDGLWLGVVGGCAEAA
jgi:hypothetical protein